MASTQPGTYWGQYKRQMLVGGVALASLLTVAGLSFVGVLGVSAINAVMWPVEAFLAHEAFPISIVLFGVYGIFQYRNREANLRARFGRENLNDFSTSLAERRSNEEKRRWFSFLKFLLFAAMTVVGVLMGMGAPGLVTAANKLSALMVKYSLELAGVFGGMVGLWLHDTLTKRNRLRHHEEANQNNHVNEEPTSSILLSLLRYASYALIIISTLGAANIMFGLTTASNASVGLFAQIGNFLLSNTVEATIVWTTAMVGAAITFFSFAERYYDERRTASNSPNSPLAAVSVVTPPSNLYRQLGLDLKQLQSEKSIAETAKPPAPTIVAPHAPRPPSNLSSPRPR